MFSEIDRGAKKRRPMQPVDESVDDGPRQEIELANAREHGRIDEPRPGNRSAFC